MSPSGSDCIKNSDEILLCWSETPDSPSREAFVQMVETHFRPEAVLLRSTLQLKEQTQVRLIGRHYTGNGIVQSCKKEGDTFILTVWIGNQEQSRPTESDRDPGPLVVHDFITDEDIDKILENLNM